MPFATTATMAGAAMGFGTQLFINALRKLPLLRNPWEHVLWTGGGVWAANAMAEWEVKLTEEVKAMQAERQAANARFMESIKSSKE
ncbi:uncharacterized protein MICPUCDRAFT_56150 [Micromonas pusilla CCMP1545]|uniref:Predicted protein n=1 Tax=Micromonas pusilla (strain CCMP1545) TaxID=564608 RepID=C1MP53_MICPC|nr:uncharacterized protein MICPUCDRAFT_56150 [Micromonas pusilla CCMP1545]EEH58869.1 predicted protein [Micromonas pusilla CCMP1545]|mmetsp:Transcript_12478/g.44883  ORF Transcript_12478/g.44883 Transcript_12478/m.44883 type:complete len:86 (-) Transcript_12478:72-329(-)|eukprot:XP_003057224.1 predicted protein [Micromonas pusilla CCMP1545]